MDASFAISRTPEAYAYPLLIKQILHSTQTCNAAQEIVHGERRYSYARLQQRVARLASALQSLGIAPGETVAVMDWDTHRYLEAYFAVPMMGAVLMTANIRLSPEQLLYTLNHSGAKAILVNTEFLPMLEAIRPQLRTVDRFVLLDDTGATEPPRGFCGEYEALVEAADPRHAFADFDENTRATIFYTTGTTGAPKGVYFSHRQIVLYVLAVTAALASGARHARVHREDVYMPITPMFHVHAWGFPYMATLLGLKQVYPGRYAPERLLALVRREKVTLSHCVPTVLHMVLSHPDSDVQDLQGWKVIIGGSALSGGLAAKARRHGIDIFTGYGMSETCSAVTVGRVGTGEQESLPARTAAGYPTPLVQLRVVDAQMNALPQDGKSAGEVVVRAPWLTQGYFHNPEASASLWADGWLHTGDVGVLDARGQLVLTDRIKDVIKSGGEWVSSIQLEDLISRHPDVSETAVVGVPDAHWGERPCAFVVGKPGAQLQAETLREHLAGFARSGEISRYAIPERIEFVDALPKTSVGKLDKRRIREQLAQARAAA